MDPFSDANLDRILRVRNDDPNRLASRESSTLEFKLSFHKASLAEYARTGAAFANARGGYIVFGVGNHPRLLVGLQNDRFETVDPKDLTQFFKQYLEPELLYEMELVEYGDATLGLIYFYEAKHKPVVCRANCGNDLKEAQIYFRYGAESSAIKYSDLALMLEERWKQKEQRWLDLFRNIASIGPDKAAVLDTRTGAIALDHHKVLLTPEQLREIKFIREGHFVEHDGAPALRLIGEATTSEHVIIQGDQGHEQVAILQTDVFEAFLLQHDVSNPAEHIRSLCGLTTGFMPVYFFMHQAQMTRRQLDSLVKKHAVTPGGRRLHQRVNLRGREALPTPGSSTSSGMARLEFMAGWQGKTLLTIPEDTARYALKALRSLPVGELDIDYVLALMGDWYQSHYAGPNRPEQDEFRRALCHIDEELYDQ